VKPVAPPAQGQPSGRPRIALARREHGGALLGLLIGVAAMGAGHLAITEHQATQSQREREAELLFIGEQFRRAIESYYLASPPEQRLLPARLEDLLVDTRGLARRTHLRRLYRDPFTGRTDWGLVRAGDRLLGVHSRAQVVPLRRAGFASTQAGFDRARTVADWRFVYVPMAAGEATRVPSPLRPRGAVPGRPSGSARDGGLVQ
jgi:hypothetical protein